MLSKPVPPWAMDLVQEVVSCWNWRGSCEHFYTALRKRNKIWELSVAPALQEVLGGAEDGRLVWTAFVFDVGAFLLKPTVHPEYVAYMSRSPSHPPFFNIDMRFGRRKVRLQVYTEPPDNVQPMETVDANNQVRLRNGWQEDIQE